MDAPDDSLTARLERSDDQYVIVVSGEIDMLTAPILQGVVDRTRDEGAGSVVFDMAAVSFIDSSGISVLLQSRNGDEPLRLRGPSRAVMRLLETTGLAQLIEVVP